jgi:hypothetical protein
MGSSDTDEYYRCLHLPRIVRHRIGFLLYMFVLGKWTASGTSYGFVIVPLVTIVVAATIAGETITLNFLLGAVFVLAGVFVGALLPSKAKPVEIEECKDRSGQVLPRCA